MFKSGLASTFLVHNRVMVHMFGALVLPLGNCAFHILGEFDTECGERRFRKLRLTP